MVQRLFFAFNRKYWIWTLRAGSHYLTEFWHYTLKSMKFILWNNKTNSMIWSRIIATINVFTPQSLFHHGEYSFCKSTSEIFNENCTEFFIKNFNWKKSIQCSVWSFIQIVGIYWRLFTCSVRNSYFLISLQLWIALDIFTCHPEFLTKSE